MIRSRLTIRSLMLVVVAIAVVLRLVVVAIVVFCQPSAQTLSHLRRFRDDDAIFISTHSTTVSQYWSEYWRRSLGIRWPGGFTCSCKKEDESKTGRPMIDIETSHDLLANLRCPDDDRSVTASGVVVFDSGTGDIPRP